VKDVAQERRNAIRYSQIVPDVCNFILCVSGPELGHHSVTGGGDWDPSNPDKRFTGHRSRYYQLCQ
jgi:hypothetical protein